MESKEKMAKQGMKSPDRADALLGCIACEARLSGAVTAAATAESHVPEGAFGGPAVTGW